MLTFYVSIFKVLMKKQEPFTKTFNKRHFFFAVFLLPFSFAIAAPPANFSGWELVFEDNFDGTSLDKSKWNPTYNWGHTHNHRAYCVEENVSVKDGKLIIKGENKRHPDAPATTTSGGETHSLDYTSGAIDTKGKFEFKYGYIEGRFKAPWQSGTWPAFWTLQDGWPPEIDILEIPASRYQHHYYLHYTDPSWYNEHGSAWDHEKSFGGHKDDNIDRSADFHTYAVEWDESNLNFYFDDKKFASYNRPTEIRQLDKQYIIINLAIGGWAGNDIEVTAESPAYYEADWVRVWQAKPAKPDTVRIMSMNFGTCMVKTEESTLALGDCNGENAIAIITQLSSSSFRINFGDIVLEIPNEKTDAGLDAGLYNWNGGNHQKVVIEKQDGYDGSVVRMKMQHSNMYLRATTDGERVIQSWSDDWTWNQMWRLLEATNDSLKEDSSTSNSKLGNISNIYETSVHQAGENLFIELGSHFVNGATIRILDLHGREIMQRQTPHSMVFDIRPLSSGIYHILVSDGKQKFLKRFRK